MSVTPAVVYDTVRRLTAVDGPFEVTSRGVARATLCASDTKECDVEP
jgi:hypothetical protein